ncbi:MAG: 4-hydroxy-3-methylbut-2-enyl diphosphate reductase [Brevinemataceae bacterium]
MKVFVPKSSGFCPGVKRAEEGVFQLKEKHQTVHTYGPLIHNKIYIDMLEKNNICTVDVDSLPENSILVIRTHGIPKQKEAELAKRFTLKDLTCPIVKRVQKDVEKASDASSFLIISGKKAHAEIQGLVSYAKHYCVIETKEQLEFFLANHSEIIPKECSALFILSQTTYSREFFETLCSEIKKNITSLPIKIKDTICPVTENKEKESLEIQKETDFTIVIGDPDSSNSKKLYNIHKENNEQTIFVHNLEHLQSMKSDWTGINNVLVVSSTSTPRFIEKEIVDFLENYSA